MRPKSVIDHRLFVERHANTPDHAADDLTVRSLRVQDTSGCNGTDNARHPDNTKLLVNLNLGKDRRMRVVRVRSIILRVRDSLLFNVSLAHYDA